MLKKLNYREIAEMTIGTILVGLSFHYLLSPAVLVTGGVTGLSIIFQELTGVSNIMTSVFMYGANIILLIIGLVVLGKRFFLKTIYGTLLLPTVTLVLSLLPIDQKIIINQLSTGPNQLIILATLGAVITGTGLGLVFKNNATTGGTDVLQKIFHEKLKIPLSLSIYLTDGAIILLGLFVSKDIELTFFAIVVIFITGKIVDNLILSGRSGYTVFIVTDDYKVLKNAIYKTINRGVTIVDAMGGFSEENKEMLICTITKNQLYHLKAIIAENDPSAFTFITKTVESVGVGFN